MTQPTFFPILPEKKKPKLTNAPTVVIDTQYNWNRASGPVQIQAQNDVEAVMTWLSEHKSTHTTYQSYKKEAERFLLWASLKAQKNLASVTREDILRFEDFLANPDPDWCGPTRPRHHPDWRPFAYWANPNQAPKLGLSSKSIHYALLVLENLFKYLVNAGYLHLNPFALKPSHRQEQDTSPIERFLDHKTLELVFASIESMPRETDKQIFMAERALWMVTLFYLTGARLREIANATMGDFKLRRGRWWLKIHGKGKKIAEVPVNSTLLSALERYRRFLGLPALPASHEEIPLIALLRHRADEPTAAPSPSTLHKIMKGILQEAAYFAKTQGNEEAHHLLSSASTHWLRHTSASHQLDGGVPLLVVSQNLRHTKLETTKRYLHVEETERHMANEGWAKKG